MECSGLTTTVFLGTVCEVADQPYSEVSWTQGETAKRPPTTTCPTSSPRTFFMSFVSGPNSPSSSSSFFL
eukprot:7114215-Lingulodinium_polyedra.AAC.1